MIIYLHLIHNQIQLGVRATNLITKKYLKYKNKYLKLKNGLI